MEKKIWFRRKLYGWGWTPCSWQGWLCIAVYLILICFFVLLLDLDATGRDVIIRFLIPVALLTLVFLEIGYKKGEKPKWQWGKRRD